MPHVSKRLLEKKRYLDIHREFFKVIAELSSSGKTTAVLDGLLTKTEKLMLAKRLAIIFMLHHKESLYAIEQTLKVSPSTAARMKYHYERGVYSELLKVSDKERDFWMTLEKILPPRTGRNRFKNFLEF